MRVFFLTIGFLIMTGCTSKKENTVVCLGNFSDLPEHGHDSKIVEFKRTAIMDSVTAIINGEILNSKDKKIDHQEILLSNANNTYKVLSDSGHFTFYHIQSGTYNLKVNIRLHRALNCDTLRISSGDIFNLKIVMGSLGKDDNIKR